jgi:GT2 family glycosyltransferase
MNNKSLNQIYSEHEGKVSDKWKIYLSEYDRLFTEYRNQAIRLLEIGVQNGGSLEIWSKYFSNAELLVGCDINQACSVLKYDDQRILLVIGDANTDSALAEVVSLSNRYNIIIDDGSHVSGDIIESFFRYFPLLENHGLFLAEDLHCSYWEKFDGGLFDPYSSIAFFKRLADIVNYEHWGLQQGRVDLLKSFQKQYGVVLDEELLSQIHSVEFTNSICVVRKAKPEENILGSRVVVGSEELVVPGHFTFESETSVAEDQKAYVHSDYFAPVEEELVKRIEEIKILLEEKDEVSIERDIMLHSRSWKITAPLRRVKPRLSRLLLLPQALRLSIKYLGGPKAVWGKVYKVYRHEGFAGVISRVRAILRKSFASNNQPLVAKSSVKLDSCAGKELHRHNQSVDIIVCVHNALDDVRCCLESVIENTMPPYRLIIVDDGSNSETAQYLDDFVLTQSGTLLRNNTATGYTRAANKGLRESKADFVILLNSDTIVSSRWVDRMIQCAESDKRIGIVGPLSNTASWQSVPKIFNDSGDWSDNPLPDGWQVRDFSNEVARVSQRIYPRVGFVNGFCFMMRRELIEKIGLFDEETFARGYGEENDYCIRAAINGWQLAIADDCYVYHAQSKSYSHERRAELSRLAGEALAAKHGQAVIDEQLAVTKNHPALEYVRKRCESIVPLRQVRERTMKLYEGKRVLFLLPASSVGGGANIVILEAVALRANGVDAWIANLSIQRELFEKNYPDLLVPVVYVDIPDDLVLVAKAFDAVIATLYSTVYWMKQLSNLEEPPVLGYYIQDFEPDFFKEDTADYHQALESYNAINGVVLFTKTDWNRNIIETKLGLSPMVIGPSVDISSYHPSPVHDSVLDAIRIAAMVRPSTPRRAPEMTMRILSRLKERFGDAVQITVFGVQCDNPEYIKLKGDFLHTCLGEIDKATLAPVLRQSDIFVDCSKFQAMGLTAMEAMACGVAVVGPVNGGLKEVITDQSNGMLVDALEEEDIFKAVCLLVEDRAQLDSVKSNAIDVVRFSPEVSAERMLQNIFGGTEKKTNSEAATGSGASL